MQIQNLLVIIKNNLASSKYIYVHKILYRLYRMNWFIANNVALNCSFSLKIKNFNSLEYIVNIGNNRLETK